MPNQFFYEQVNSKITKINNLEVSIECQVFKDTIIIYDAHCTNNDITKVIIGDGFLLEYESKVVIKSIVKVDSVDYYTITKVLPKTINIKFSKVKNQVEKASITNNNTHNYNAPHQNIAINSSDFLQNISNIEQSVKDDPEVQAKIIELEKAISEKNTNKFLDVTKFLFDKGFDVGVTLLGAYFSKNLGLN